MYNSSVRDAPLDNGREARTNVVRKLSMLFAIEKKQTQKQTIYFLIYIHCCLKILANNLVICTFDIAIIFFLPKSSSSPGLLTLKNKKYCYVPLTFSDAMLHDDVNAFYQPYHCFQSFHHG